MTRARRNSGSPTPPETNTTFLSGDLSGLFNGEHNGEHNFVTRAWPGARPTAASNAARDNLKSNRTIQKHCSCLRRLRKSSHHKKTILSWTTWHTQITYLASRFAKVSCFKASRCCVASESVAAHSRAARTPQHHPLPSHPATSNPLYVWSSPQVGIQARDAVKGSVRHAMRPRYVSASVMSNMMPSRAVTGIKALPKYKQHSRESSAAANTTGGEHKGGRRCVCDCTVGVRGCPSRDLRMMFVVRCRQCRGTSGANSRDGALLGQLPESSTGQRRHGRQEGVRRAVAECGGVQNSRQQPLRARVPAW